ncbi:hypothetical protein PQR53_33150 [Paraburkholderia fungorum]|uniref:hypothetical protein n=1 Tax=Paraburkholderia fungorum TaxID=134537 RepID=UPI0038BC2348
MRTENKNFICHFVDHGMIEKQAISDYLEDTFQRTIPDISEGQAAVLVTCQRAELYCFGELNRELAAEILGPLMDNAHTIRGTTKVLRRLSEIAAGAHSWLLGEEYIEHQVQRAFSHTKENTQLRWLGNKAIQIAKKVKVQHEFRSIRDYPEIALDIAEDATKRWSVDENALFIIGGGMLGRALVNAALQRNWNEITLITRTPKKLRRLLSNKCIISKLSDLPTVNPGCGFCIVIASLDLDDDYKQRIAELASSVNCFGIIDLSARRTFSAPPSDLYIHMYGKRFSDIVTKNNFELGIKLPELLGAISDMAERSIQGIFPEEDFKFKAAEEPPLGFNR